MLQWRGPAASGTSSAGALQSRLPQPSDVFGLDSARQPARPPPPRTRQRPILAATAAARQPPSSSAIRRESPRAPLSFRPLCVSVTCAEHRRRWRRGSSASAAGLFMWRRACHRGCREPRPRGDDEAECFAALAARYAPAASPAPRRSRFASAPRPDPACRLVEQVASGEGFQLCAGVVREPVLRWIGQASSARGVLDWPRFGRLVRRRPAAKSD